METTIAIIALLVIIALLLIIISSQIIAVYDILEEIKMNTLKKHLCSYEIIGLLERRRRR